MVNLFEMADKYTEKKVSNLIYGQSDYLKVISKTSEIVGELWPQSRKV